MWLGTKTDKHKADTERNQTSEGCKADPPMCIYSHRSDIRSTVTTQYKC